MPAGVAVVVENGFATIDFVDSAKKGPGLQALLDVGTPPELIDKLTRSGPRARYVVPEGNAREAGLLDEVSEVDALEQPDTSSARNASGAVPPEFPSTRDLHAQVLRSGTYSQEFAEGGVITGPASDDSIPVQLDSGYVVPGDGVLKDGVLAQLNETVELLSEDTGGPYTILPEIENLDGTAPLDAIIGVADAGTTSDGEAQLIEIPGGGTVENPAKAWPDGEPELDWKRPELDAYAASKGLDTRELQNKRDVLAAIEAKVGQ